MSRKANYYIDNDKFYAEMKIYIKEYRRAKRKKEPFPIINEYIGECFLKISSGLVNRPNFINYTFREDFISDGVINCLLYAHNFDPKKTKNPFAYFTQIVYFSFVRRIKKEGKQYYLKFKLIEQSGVIDDLVATVDNDEHVMFQKQFTEFLRSHKDYREIADEKNKIKVQPTISVKSPRRKKNTTLTKFIK